MGSRLRNLGGKEVTAMENKQERNKPELEDLTLEEFSIEELEDRLELQRFSDGNCNCGNA
jgi:hypothetical protein